MGRRRDKLATGIYRDKFGIAIIVSVHGRPTERRTDAHGVPYATYTREQLITARNNLKKNCRPPRTSHASDASSRPRHSRPMSIGTLRRSRHHRIVATRAG